MRISPAVANSEWHVDPVNPEIVRDEEGNRVAECRDYRIAEFVERAVDLYLCIDAQCPVKGPHPGTWALPAIDALSFCCDEAREHGSVTEADLKGAYEVRGVDRIRGLFSNMDRKTQTAPGKG